MPTPKWRLQSLLKLKMKATDEQKEAKKANKDVSKLEKKPKKATEKLKEETAAK